MEPQRTNLVARIVLALLLIPAVAPPTHGQSLLTAKETAAADRLFALAAPSNSLGCRIDKQKPRPDFTFHFVAGYIVECPFWNFGGRDSRVRVFVRITPQGRTPVLLGTFATLKGLPKGLSLLSPANFKGEFDLSGSFLIGEGRYHVEVLVADRRNRICRRAWNITVSHRKQSKIPVVSAPRTVSPVTLPLWQGPQANGGLRVTVLLDASPIGNPRASRLHARDRVEYLQLLSSLLGQTPCRSVRLVAFNLNQQRVVFRSESFNSSGFAKLNRALRGLELSTVSVRNLQRRQGKLQLLTDLLHRELTDRSPPDAVIFLGRTAYWVKRAPEKLRRLARNERTRFFCFQYPGWGFSDATGTLTKSLGGTVFRIYDPHSMGEAIQKMLAHLPPSAANRALR